MALYVICPRITRSERIEHMIKLRGGPIPARVRAAVNRKWADEYRWKRLRRQRRERAAERRAIMRAIRHEHRYGCRRVLARAIVDGYIEVRGPGWGMSIPAEWYGIRRRS
jgi:hypothetical protein